MPLRDYQRDAKFKLLDFFEHYHIEQGLGFCSMPTASGKTLTMAATLRAFIKCHSDYKIIWIAPEWELLSQTLDGLRLVFGRVDGFRRIGKGCSKLNSLPTDLDGQIFLTTLHSAYQANLTPFKRLDARLLVVFDEAHWGINARMLVSIIQFFRDPLYPVVPVIGLSATPRVPLEFPMTLVVQISYAELAFKGYLALPIVHRLPTHVHWDPLINQRGCISAQSLRTLDMQQRNELIVNTVCAILKQYPLRRGILFAIDIAHAQCLYRLLSSELPISLVFGKQKGNEWMIDQFRRGHHRLMIAVNKLIMGFDVPEITDVFLARPCDSEIMLAQMIGRGSRVIKGQKQQFHVHDFYDVINDNKASKIFHCTDYFGDAAFRRPSIHQYPESPNISYLGDDFGVWAGLEFVENMTFGVELEITSPDKIPRYGTSLWNRGAKLLIAMLSRIVGPEWVYQRGVGYHESHDLGIETLWRVEFDCSAGWEIISPILCGVSDLHNLLKVCQALKSLIVQTDWLLINWQCGFHLTLASNLVKSIQRRQMAALISRLEPGLFSLVMPSRLFEYDQKRNTHNLIEYNVYCEPLSNNAEAMESMIERPRQFRVHAERECSVNFTQFDEKHHIVEVRMHHGTVDAMEIIPWIALWMRIFVDDTKRRTFSINYEGIFAPNTSTEQEDILGLLVREQLDISPQLVAQLFNQRLRLKRFWQEQLPEKMRPWTSSGFYDGKRYGVA
ncbi:MAG: DEAD/DEAH box helicase family protein [Methylomonas sp.]|uniref:DEAD/DEAH box helicase family protein n=1 Tax=Methylomonas sp. TaxID=418 RepID=UPI0025CC6306|nr:DEAD/DEAH box helicase family protein [Methylomonas sp.]MCK9608682.1 DEAD/DEAH box helicase family protein [Methylomonas sp.]